MFKKVLVANRGEIAVRIIRTLREMGIYSVAVYSQADMPSLHVRMADKAVCIGPAAAAKSYLDINAIIAAAKMTGAEAIHPGYGFLSENADFAEACADAGITFIGPSAETMRHLGDKSAARRMAIDSGIPVVPGTRGCVPPENALEEAEKIGFPVMIKAAAGGGGKGIRIVTDKESLLREYQVASAEAAAAFGNNGLYFEKYIENPRHIEIQFVRDAFGNTITFPERDCSIQRRHQKLIEETPSPAVNAELRGRLSDAAVKLACAAGYAGAGTAEFLLDKNGNFYFMEVNARLQVEHPVTEAVSGYDLAKMQIIAAAGLSICEGRKNTAENIAPQGCAMEFRINAENPKKNFAPCAGTAKRLSWPGGPGVRIDTHVYSGYTLPIYYDSLIAKLIISAPDRQQTLCRAERALEEFETDGITTTASFCMEMLKDSNFRAGITDTGLAERLIANKNSAAEKQKKHSKC